MEYRKSGKSDLLLSAISLGCWSFGGGDYWGRQDQKDVDEVVRFAVDAGINFFDTAEFYNEGRSESSLGKAIKGIPRDKLIIGSKISPSNCYPGVLEKHCEDSLVRLGTDYLDVYMIHWPIHPHSVRHFTKDENVIANPPLNSDAFGTLMKLRDEGKIRYIGISNYSRKRMISDIPGGTDIALNELAYNLLSRAIEFETLPYCHANGVGVLGYIGLMQGILTGKYRSINEIPILLRRTRHFNASGNPKIRHGEDGFEKETQRALDDIRSLAEQTGLTMTDLAVVWVMSNKAVTSTLMGARNVFQLSEVISSAEIKPEMEIISELDALTGKLKEKMGNCFDYWESVENDRT